MAAITQTEHGTITGYATRKCRCDECREAMRDYTQERRTGYTFGPERHALISDLLHELFPDGLTSDAPRAKAKAHAR